MEEEGSEKMKEVPQEKVLQEEENPKQEKIEIKPQEDINKISTFKKIKTKLNKYLDDLVEATEKEDPNNLGFFQNVRRQIKRALFRNPKTGEPKLSEAKVNIIAKGIRKLIPETRSNKMKTLLLIIAGLLTTMGVLIGLHKTHHIIPKKKSHKHIYKHKYE